MPDNGNQGDPSTSGGSVAGNIAKGVLGSLPVVGSIFNAVETGIQNKKARDFQLKMYQMQRQDALDDWNRQNAYNSPEQQMARYRAAGLNPNLIYGSGTTAASASMPRQSSPGTPSNRVPQVDVNAFSSMYDFRIKSAQLDLLQQQRQLLQQETDNKKIDQLLTIAKTDLTRTQNDAGTIGVQLKGVDLDYASRIKATSLAALEAAVKKTDAQTQLLNTQNQFQIDENERRNLVTGMTVKEAATRILQMRAQTLRTQYETENILPQVKQRMIWQVQQIESTIDNINNASKVKGEQYRLLQSTPDWGDQKSVDMLNNFLGGVTKNFQNSARGKDTYSGKWTQPYKYDKDTKDYRSWYGQGNNIFPEE